MEFLTCTDVGRDIDRAAGTVRWLADTGQLRVAARTLGGVRLFERSDVEEFKARRAGSAHPKSQKEAPA